MNVRRSLRPLALATLLASALVASSSAAAGAGDPSPAPSSAHDGDGVEYGGVRRGTREQKKLALIIVASALGVYVAYRLVRR